MIARWSFAVLMLILSGWLYWLTALVMRAIDRAEQLIDREHRVLPEDETPEAEGGDWYAKLRAGAEAINARMQPTFLEPEPDPYAELRERSRVDWGLGQAPKTESLVVAGYEPPITEPAPAVRPSPVPRTTEPPPDPTVPMERAWEESAAELTEQQQWEAEREAKWAEIKADIERMAKGIVT